MRGRESEPGTSRPIGAGLVKIPRVDAGNPDDAVIADASVPEAKRFCRSCQGRVGRSLGGLPGATTGSCQSCNHPFSFVPPLRRGDVVNRQYEIKGCLGFGGLGWVYLAVDRVVAERFVVLKGVIDPGDPDLVHVSTAERRFLAKGNHPNIVKIHNFVEHDGPEGRRSGYIVMEYVKGPSLREILERRAGPGGSYRPLSLDQALAYVLEILPAFGYLHDLGLLYCDFKPDNFIDTGDRIMLIDLGAVRSLDDGESGVWGTIGYQAPEIARGVPPSVGSDLYTVGRTLAVLSFVFDYQGEYSDSLPPSELVEALERNESFARLLARSAAPAPADRFTSAAEMAGQVLGVLRETVAADAGPTPGPSTLFTGERRADVTPGKSAHGADWRELPLPLVDSGDPASGFLDSITVTEPAELLALLDSAPGPTVETELQALRVVLYGGQATARDVTSARQRLARIEKTFGPDWRCRWFDGVIHLADRRPDEAVAAFDALFSLLPGELAVKLALAVGLELARRHVDAARQYDVVSRTDPSFTTACAGLARCRLALCDRTGAVEAHHRVPGTSSARRAARIDAIGALLRAAPNGAATVTAGHLSRAAALIGEVSGSEAELAALRATLLQAAMETLASGATVPAGDLEIDSATENGIRSGLEQCYRRMARHTAGRERIRLVDQANAVRPWTYT